MIFIKKHIVTIFIFIFLTAILIYQENRINNLETALSYVDTYSIEEKMNKTDQKIDDISKYIEILDNRMSSSSQDIKKLNNDALFFERRLSSLESNIDSMAFTLNQATNYRYSF